VCQILRTRKCQLISKTTIIAICNKCCHVQLFRPDMLKHFGVVVPSETLGQHTIHKIPMGVGMNLTTEIG
jgi:hypothetical protein